MQDDALHDVIHHLHKALAAADNSSRQHAALQQRAESAESELSSCQLQRAQTAAEFQVCQLQCQDLQQHLTKVRAELAAVQDAGAANKQQIALANQQLSQKCKETQLLQQQLLSAQQDNQQQLGRLQGQLQGVQAELLAAQSSRDLLLQQLQQQDAQLQELLCAAAPSTPANPGSDDELPTTQYEHAPAADLQQPQTGQHSHDIEALKAQVCRLLDDNAVLQVRNESLDQQLSVSKLELLRLQHQLARAAAQQQQTQQPAQQGQQSGQHQEQCSNQGKVLHDKAYYKRKYIEVRDKYDTLKRQRQQRCPSCQRLHANNQQQLVNGSSGLSGKQQTQAAAAEEVVPAAAGGGTQQAVALLQHKGRAGATAIVASPAEAVVQARTSTPVKAVVKQTGLAVGQPSPQTAAAAARLAAAFTPPGKRRKANAAVATAAATAADGIQVDDAELRPSTHLAVPVTGDAAAPGSGSNTQGLHEGLKAGAAGIPSADQQGRQQQQQARKQQSHSDACEPTVPLNTGTDGTNETVMLPQQHTQLQDPDEQQHKGKQSYRSMEGADAADDLAKVLPQAQQPQLGREQHQTKKRHRRQQVTNAAAAGDDAGGMDLPETAGPAAAPDAAAGQRTAAAEAIGSSQHIRQKHNLGTAKSAPAPDCQQQQQQESIGGRSPAWRAARRGRSKTAPAAALSSAAAAAVADSVKPDIGPAAQPGHGPKQKQIAAHRAAGTAAAADSDSDFDCRAPPKPSSKLQQQQHQQQLGGLQQKVAEKRARAAGNNELVDCLDLTQEEPEPQPKLPQQQQQPNQHGGRRRGITPGPQQQQQLGDVSAASHGQPAKQQVGVSLRPTVDDEQEVQPAKAQQQPQQLEQQPASRAGSAGPPAAMPSRFTVVCSRPVARQQPAATAMLAAPKQPPGAPASDPGPGGVSNFSAGQPPDETPGAENKPPGNVADYKYQEVVRKRAARELLPAFECDECKKVYAALQSWGATAGELGLPTCGHAAPRGPGAAADVDRTGSSGAGAARMPPAVYQLMQNAGRHRAKWKPPSTPPGFWHIGFTPDHDSSQVRQ